MEKKIRIFKSFDEQELYFLRHFANLTPSERLQELSKLQMKDRESFSKIPIKKISIRKHFIYGH